MRTPALSSTQPAIRGLAFCALAILLAGCEKEDRATRAARDGILLLGNGAEPRALDPHLVQSVGDSSILRALFEGLTTYHPTDDSIHNPGVAKSWDSNEDFTEWTFHLRDNARWSNGDPVTAHDFIYAYSRLLDPNMGGPYTSMLFFLKNGEAYNKGDVKEFADVGVKAPDDYTLVCTLEDPTPFFPDVVKHTTWYPVHQATIEKFGGWTEQYTAWQKPGNHVGNGAFRLKEWRVNGHVTVERNPYYWDTDNVKLNGIVFYPLDNAYTEERAFRDGLIHMTYQLAPAMVDWYRENRPDLLRIETYAGVYFFRCNVTREPLDNKYLRKALAHAIDQETIVEYVSMGGQIPAFGFTPSSESEDGYHPPNVVKFDPELAKEYLRKAGFESGADVPEFDIIINTSESHKAIAAAVQDMWKKHLGIENVTISNQEWKVFQQTLKDLNYDVARSGWIADYVDPNTFLSMWRSNDSNNETGWENAEYDALLKEAAGLSDPAARYAKMYEAEEILLDELPVLPIYWYTRVYTKSPHVKNWHPLLLDNHPWKHIGLSVDDGEQETAEFTGE